MSDRKYPIHVTVRLGEDVHPDLGAMLERAEMTARIEAFLTAECETYNASHPQTRLCWRSLEGRLFLNEGVEASA